MNYPSQSRFRSSKPFSKPAIALLQPALIQSAPLWSGLLIGTLLTVATPTVAATLSQTAAVKGWETPATERYSSQSMPDSTMESMPHSTTDSTTDPATSFQRIDQPLGIKILVTVGGLALLAGELWWFLGHHIKSDA